MTKQNIVKEGAKGFFSLSLLVAFILFSIATTRYYNKIADSEEIALIVTPDQPRRLLALTQREALAQRVGPLELLARYSSFSSDDEGPGTRNGENAVRIRASNSEGDERSVVVDDNASALFELESIDRCDTERCAGYSLLSLEHERGNDAELILKLQRTWDFVNPPPNETRLTLISCSDQCQNMADNFLADTLDPCALEDEPDCFLAPVVEE